MSSNTMLIILLICITLSSISLHLSIIDNILTNKSPLLKLCQHYSYPYRLSCNKDYSFRKFNLYSYRINIETSRAMVDNILRLADERRAGLRDDNISIMTEVKLNNSISKLLKTYRLNISSRDTKNASLLPLIDEVVYNYRYSIIDGSMKNYMYALAGISIPTIFGLISIKTMILLVV